MSEVGRGGEDSIYVETTVHGINYSDENVVRRGVNVREVVVREENADEE